MLLGDDATAPLEPAVVRYRERPKTVDEGRIPVSRTIITHTLEKGEGILSTNAMSDTALPAGRLGAGVRHPVGDLRADPGGDADRSGVIHIDSSFAQFTFTDSQLRLLSAPSASTRRWPCSATELVRVARMQNERLAAMGETVAWLSHSIKNILQGLRGGADAVELAINRRRPELAKQGWPILARNLDRIYALTLNMLAFSKQRELDLELSPTCTQLIQEVGQLVQPRVRSASAWA